MTREMKFRAWDNDMKKMRLVRQIDFGLISKNGQTIVCEPKTRLIPREYELMQYTGLKDKNGKEIYEGDIVIQVGVKQDGKTRLVRKPRVVEWVYTKSTAGFNLAPSPESYADRTMLRTEIIGNVFENPDLLS